MSDYKKLDVGKKSPEIYMFIKKNIALKFLKKERYELTSQLLRNALSVPLNIVEGCSRFTDKDFPKLLDTSPDTTNETDYCCFAALELNYITNTEYEIINKLINEVRAMLIAFPKHLN